MRGRPNTDTTNSQSTPAAAGAGLLLGFGVVAAHCVRAVHRLPFSQPVACVMRAGAYLKNADFSEAVFAATATFTNARDSSQPATLLINISLD